MRGFHFLDVQVDNLMLFGSNFETEERVNIVRKNKE